MKKLIDKFLKRDMIIYSGIIVGVYCFIFNFMINVFTGTNMFLNFILILGYLAGLAASVILTAGTVYFYLKKSKDTTILILAIDSAIVTLLSLFGIQFVSALISLGSKDYYSILASYSSWIAGLGIYGWAFYIAYLGALYSVVLCLEMKNVIQIPKLKELYENATVVNPTIAQPVQNAGAPVVTEDVAQVQNVEQTTNATQPIQEQFVPQTNQVQNPKKKKGLIIGIVIACLIVLCGSGYFVYSTFFSSTSIDLVKSAELKLNGDDGKGYASITAETDYEGDDENVEKFLSTVYYMIDDSGDVRNGELTNGQKAKVVASYSKSTAKKYNVKVTNDSFEVEVKGLVARYTDGAQIPADLLKKMKEDTNKKAQDSLYNSSVTKETTEFDSAYFAGANQYSNRIIMVYKTTSVVNSLAGTGSETTTKYYAYYMSNPKSDYNSEDAYWFTLNLYGNDFKVISKKEDIKPTLIKKLYVSEDKLKELTIAN